MGTRIGTLIGLLLFSCGLPHWAIAIDAPDMPDVSPIPVPGSLVQTEGLSVRFLSHRGEWTLLPLLTVTGTVVMTFLISGQLENTSGKPLTYVKLQFELLGEDEIVVFRDYGYNRKAETLREEAYETGQKVLADMGVEEIGVGAHDGFRFFFFKGEVPEFRSYRIRVLETR
jgi:hypothetical protein